MQPRIVSTQTKLAQKVENFTVFESFPSTSCCWQNFHQIREKFGWLYIQGVSGMFTLDGWVAGGGLAEKVIAQNFALLKPRKQPEWVVATPWWLKWSKINTVDLWTAKTSSNTGYSQPRDLPVAETAIQAFHITMNSLLLQSASSR